MSHHHRPISETPFEMAFRWRADGGPLFDAYWDAWLGFDPYRICQQRIQDGPFPPDSLTIAHLTLYRPMDSSIKLQTIHLEIFRGHRLLIFNKNVFYSLKNNFVLANSADPDEMLHYSTFYLGLHCLPKYPLRVIIVYSAPSCASQPISLHRILNFWPT